jgi:hypothetical protein
MKINTKVFGRNGVLQNRSQDGCAVLRVVPHEVEALVGGQPLVDRGHLAEVETAVQVSRDEDFNLIKVQRIGVEFDP